MPQPSQIQGLDHVIAEFHFEDDAELLWHELSGVLSEFQRVYLECLLLSRNNLNLTLEEKMKWQKDDIRERLAEMGSLFRMRDQEPYFFENAISITRIRYESPLVICATCLAAPLVLAVILSGGKIEIDIAHGKFKASLPPISKVLAELKQLFGR